MSSRQRPPMSRATVVAFAGALGALSISGIATPAVAVPQPPRLAAHLAAADPALKPPKAPKPKVVKLSAKQYPKLIDTAGEGGTATFTNVAGVVWKLNDTPIVFTEKAKTRTVTVNGAFTAYASAAPADAKNTYSLAGPSEWTFGAPSDATESVAAADIKVTWLDAPGEKKDAVILPRVDGITWKVGTDEIPVAKFGKKTTLQVKATSSSAVSATLVPGYTLTGGSTVPTFTNSLTSTETIAYSAGTLAAGLSVGDDPEDASKGMGKGAALESVLVQPVPGVKWKVGGGKAKPKAYKTETFVPVQPDDLLDGKVTVTAEADKGYSVPDKWSTTVTFPDLPESYTVAVPTGARSDDRGGVAKDTLILPVQRGMTWFAAVPDKDGAYSYKPLKNPKAGDTVTYKVKHPKADEPKPTIVKYQAVADRGYRLTGGGVRQASLSQAEVVIPSADQVSVSGGVATIKPADGVVSWTVEVTVGEKTQKLTIKAADLSASGASSMTVPGVKGTPVTKVDKGYTLAK